MMLPDIIGFTLGEALKKLREAGLYNIIIKLTAPPRNIDDEYTDNSRVVRVRTIQSSEIIELVVCNIV